MLIDHRILRIMIWLWGSVLKMIPRNSITRPCCARVSRHKRALRSSCTNTTSRDFLQPQLDSEINAYFLLDERSDLCTFQYMILIYKLFCLSWKEEKSLRKTVAWQQRLEERCSKLFNFPKKYIQHYCIFSVLGRQHTQSELNDHIDSEQNFEKRLQRSPARQNEKCEVKTKQY